MNYIQRVANEICTSDELDVLSEPAIQLFKQQLVQTLAMLVQDSTVDSKIVQDAFAIPINE